MRRNSTDEREKMNRRERERERERELRHHLKMQKLLQREKSKGDQKVAWIRKILKFTYKCAIMTPLHSTVR
jgi:hypothetical protein